MRGAIAKISDSLLSLVAPRATASAKYCIACERGNCQSGWYGRCLNGQLGWIDIVCASTCP
ncbi:hypothetical protein [Dactylosporangium sp. NPDC048998]|uniref:hypothetical protein n=1 Tax=Dactylosporangium sp. NPDC048998 TaxID=3363976 RepID=UPI0037199AC6